MVEASFYDQQVTRLDSNLPAIDLTTASVFLMLFGFMWRKTNKTNSRESEELEWNEIKIDLGFNRLVANGKRIQLTDKEATVLVIIFKNAGKLVSRQHLLQEVWLNKGVVSSRSLDMYISRLTKKLEALPHVRIINQHGKGYFLSIE